MDVKRESKENLGGRTGTQEGELNSCQSLTFPKPGWSSEREWELWARCEHPHHCRPAIGVEEPEPPRCLGLHAEPQNVESACLLLHLLLRHTQLVSGGEHDPGALHSNVLSA